MEENTKKYDIIGTVTIGTDEYRDLLTEKFNAEKEKTEWHDKWYKEYTERSRIEVENKKLKEELDRIRKCLSKSKAFADEDGVAIFMSIFGEE